MTSETLIEARLALHAVAEHLLAGDLWRHTGRIGLRRTPGGFGQPETTVDGTRRRLRIDCSAAAGTRLVVLDGDDESWHQLTSLDDAARAAGAQLGAPADAFTPTTSLDPTAPLRIDTADASRLAGWFALVEEALEELRRRHSDRSPTLVQLWPEHFDLACSMSEANFGGSPGDAEHDEPYLYVGPWSPVEGSQWNESWGMSRSSESIVDVDAAVAFFEDGLGSAAS